LFWRRHHGRLRHQRDTSRRRKAASLIAGGTNMDDLIASLRQSIEAQAWYGALALAVALPDICARVETPRVPSSTRYPRWWNDHLFDQYSLPDLRGGDAHVLLDGQDAYALRCAFLHEGQIDITEQKARRAIDRFHFAAGRDKHRIRMDQVLLLSTPLFCEDIATATERWAGTRKASGQTIEPETLLKIIPAGTSYTIGGFRFYP
jgi:hypothetical protein